MAKHRSAAVSDARDIAGEIVRRAGLSQGASGERVYVIRVSDPPTPSEQLQLMAARLMRWPVAIMPVKCQTAAQWLSRYANGQRSPDGGSYPRARG